MDDTQQPATMSNKRKFSYDLKSKYLLRFFAALSMYQNVMTLSLYQTSLLAWDDAWMWKGWNSLLNNPDTTKKHPPHTRPKKRVWNGIYAKNIYFLLDLKLIATARPYSYAPLIQPHHQLAPIHPCSRSLVASEQNEQTLSSTTRILRPAHITTTSRWRDEKMERKVLENIFKDLLFTMGICRIWNENKILFSMYHLGNLLVVCDTQSSPFLYLCMDDWGV